jgi:hypothetical protein
MCIVCDMINHLPLILETMSAVAADAKGIQHVQPVFEILAKVHESQKVPANAGHLFDHIGLPSLITAGTVLVMLSHKLGGAASMIASEVANRGDLDTIQSVMVDFKGMHHVVSD